MTPSESVFVARDGATATLTLNRPSRKNALDDRGWRLLRGALDDLAADDAVRAVVVTGAGGDFCAGADLGGGPREEHPVARMRRIGAIAAVLAELPKPVIAKVEGVAAGAGWNLALACDLVVAAESARFSQIFARRGLSLDFGGSWFLPRLVGLQQAKRLALLAEPIGAAEAHDLGLVTWVKPPDELAGFVTELAQRLAALPPVALAQTKALLHQGADGTLREAIGNEANAQAVNLATEDAPAAFRAFLDKTAPPAYTGRWALR
ncbi:enoyl-CoA hydratase/isomerase family protein [Actinomadura chibensis]|uniref:Enoyl-CoA hydratase n=1 Tax=Actinomadura chibensis TaxID=392828 RepID=A0A5D0NUX6_9ACTN|nr:enoyl-CoA hydratase-related protein [Actinomadura chibensis]TYB48207.1 enoyl-CoA hydratase [Actinomadura chibensis]